MHQNNNCTYDKGRDIFNGHMFEWTYPYVLKSIFQLPDPRGLPFVVNFDHCIIRFIEVLQQSLLSNLHSYGYFSIQNQILNNFNNKNKHYKLKFATHEKNNKLTTNVNQSPTTPHKEKFLDFYDI